MPEQAYHKIAVNQMIERVYVCGYKGRGLIGRAINWFTYGKISHVSLVFELSSGQWIEIESMQPKGVRERSWQGEGSLFEVPCCYSQKKTIYATARNLIKSKYDFVSILGFITRKSMNSSNRFHCGEFALHCLAKGGVELQRMPHHKAHPTIICASPILIPRGK